MSSEVDKHSQDLPGTVLSNLLLLQAYHVKHGMLLQLYEEPRLSLLIKNGQRPFLQTKTVCRPITKIYFLKITTYQSTNDDKPNIKISLKLALSSFMNMSEITLTSVRQANLLLENTKVTRADISFSEFDQFVTLGFKTSKITSTTLGY